MNDPVIYSSMYLELPISLENTVRWYQKNLNSLSRVDLVFEEEGENVAMGGLVGIDRGVRKAELYVFVKPSMHVQGIGTRVTRLICKYAFDMLNLNKVCLYTDETNVRAQKVYEKVGFKLEGRFREETYVKDGYKNRLYYGLLVSEFDTKTIELNFIY